MLCEDATDPEVEQALDVLNNWRAAHSFPLNTFQMWMRRRAGEIYENALVAQRIKRVPSIVHKLGRFPGMKLSRMQDIGGCRAVLKTSAQVRRLCRVYKQSGIKHTFVGEKDYISDPKSSGYRCVHLVYRYRSDKNSVYDGLQIELQLRSRLQHAWATAVETMGTFLERSLKASQGPAVWLQFFALCGSAFARVEKTPLVPGTPTTKRELNRTIKRMARELDVYSKLQVFGAALRYTASPGAMKAHYFLLSLRAMGKGSALTVEGFEKNQLAAATMAYLAAEKSTRGAMGAETVLVAADSLRALRRAYPNYFLDTNVFIFEMKRATQD